MSDDTTETPAAPKKKGINLVLVLVPVALIAGLVLAFVLPPSHARIVNGPLKPLFARIGLASSKTAGTITAHSTPDPAAEVSRLTTELDSARKTEADKDARIAQLQSEVTQLHAPAKVEASPAATPKPSPTAVSEDVKRAAAYWAGMDADKAAVIAQRLPDAYVRTVFGQMPPDAVAEIMNALPAKSAANLTARTQPDQP